MKQPFVSLKYNVTNKLPQTSELGFQSYLLIEDFDQNVSFFHKSYLMQICIKDLLSTSLFHNLTRILCYAMQQCLFLS